VGRPGAVILKGQQVDAALPGGHGGLPAQSRQLRLRPPLPGGPGGEARARRGLQDGLRGDRGEARGHEAARLCLFWRLKALIYTDIFTGLNMFIESFQAI